MLDINRIQEHIHDANLEYDKRFMTNDISFYNNLYTSDASIMPEGNPSLNGTEAIMQYYYNNGNNINLKAVIKAEEIVCSPEIIVEIGAYEIKNPAETLDEGKFIALWKTENNTLKLYKEIWNTNLS